MKTTKETLKAMGMDVLGYGAFFLICGLFVGFCQLVVAYPEFMVPVILTACIYGWYLVRKHEDDL